MICRAGEFLLSIFALQITSFQTPLKLRY